jgi:hypothetical protein
LSSEKEKFEGFRPYFKEPTDDSGPVPLKEISLMPSTIETIDYAIFDWLNETLDIFCTTNEGWSKVPIVWSMAERAHQIKSNKDLRNSEGVFTLPVMSIERTSLIKDPSMKGVAWSHLPNYNDPRGGAIEVARRIQQNKTSNFANATSGRKYGQQNFPFANKKVVYETITMPIPTYVVANYKLSIRTEFQQQMNEVFTPFMTYTGQINNFFITRDGHKFEGFIEGDFGLENNLSNLAEEERKFETVINLKILGYLLSADKNSERPKVTIRENAVEVKMPRERVIFGDKKEFE